MALPAARLPVLGHDGGTLMPGMGFQRRFAELVRSGEKRHTIRLEGRKPIAAGDDLFLYVDRRRPTQELLLYTSCSSVRPMMRHEPGRWAYRDVEGGMLSPLDLEHLARGDGFAGRHEFDAFFSDQYGDELLPRLQLITWAFPGKVATHD